MQLALLVVELLLPGLVAPAATRIAFVEEATQHNLADFATQIALDFAPVPTEALVVAYIPGEDEEMIFIPRTDGVLVLQVA